MKWQDPQNLSKDDGTSFGHTKLQHFLGNSTVLSKFCELLETSIKSIKEQLKGKLKGFSMPTANEENIYKIFVSLNPKKAAGNDLIPPKVVVKAAEILSKPLTDVINATISKGIFPSNAKLASVKPMYKKGSRLDVSNYRPISVISACSKVIDKHFESSMVDYINSILSQ